MNMIDRLTGALLRAFFSRPIEEQNISVTQDEAKDLIKAVLLELREPTEEMVKSASANYDITKHDAPVVWVDMIDAALKE